MTTRDRTFRLFVAICPFALALVACSAAKSETTNASTDALGTTCGPLQTRDCGVVSGGGGSSGGNLSSIHPLTGVVCACVPVTGTPDPRVNGSDCSMTTPIAPPPALAALGCTVGVRCDGYDSNAIWACPTGGTLPTNLGYATPCPPPSIDQMCETLSSGSQVQSPNIGPPLPGWILVEDIIQGSGAPVHCPGGCGGT